MLRKTTELTPRRATAAQAPHGAASGSRSAMNHAPAQDIADMLKLFMMKLVPQRLSSGPASVIYGAGDGSIVSTSSTRLS